MFNFNQPLIVEAIDAILPQTQCRQCGYAGCKPYAVALANGEADINQCPPGGEAGVRQLAKLMGVQYKPLNPDHGIEKPKAIALIVESACIGCTLCIKACPVDAIIGASKMMHTVITQECTGCELCLPPCPMDCIVMKPILTETKLPFKINVFADKARNRYQFRNFRLAREQKEMAQKQHEQATLIKSNAALALLNVSITSTLNINAAKNNHD